MRWVILASNEENLSSGLDLSYGMGTFCVSPLFIRPYIPGIRHTRYLKENSETDRFLSFILPDLLVIIVLLRTRYLFLLSFDVYVQYFLVSIIYLILLSKPSQTAKYLTHTHSTSKCNN